MASRPQLNHAKAILESLHKYEPDRKELSDAGPGHTRPKHAATDVDDTAFHEGRLSCQQRARPRLSGAHRLRVSVSALTFDA